MAYSLSRDAPVVAVQVQPAVSAHQRIDPAGPASLSSRSHLRFSRSRQHLLGPRQIVDPHEAVVPLLEADPRLAHPPGQVLPSVEAHLDAKRQPGRQPHVHQPELPVQVVKVQVQALALLAAKPKAALGRSRRIEKLMHGSTHRSTHTSPSVIPSRSAICLGPGLLVLAAAGQVLERTARLLGHLLGVLDQTLGQTHRQRPEVLVPHAHGSQEPIQALAVTDRTQRAAKQHPVKTTQHPDDILLGDAV